MANTTVNIDIQVQSKSLNELEKELADINAELKEVPVGSQAFKDLSLEAQGLTKELNKANEAAEGFTSEDKFRAADGAIKILAGSLASTVGTLGLLGVESEAFGEFEKKAASAISAAIGIKDLSEGFSQVLPLASKAGTAIKGFSLTTKQALIATGIGAFVVVLGTVIAYWDDITAAVEEFGQKIPFVGKAIQVVKDGFDALVNAFRPVLEFLNILPDEVERANAAVIESNNEVIEERQREIAILRAQGATAEEIYKKKKELLEAELDNLKRNNADEKEIKDKQLELDVAREEENTRKRKQEQDRRTRDAKKAADERVKIEKEAAELAAKIRKQIEEGQQRISTAYEDAVKLRDDITKTNLRLAELDAKTEEERVKFVKDALDVELSYVDDAQKERRKKIIESYKRIMADTIFDNAATIKAFRQMQAELIAEAKLTEQTKTILRKESQQEIDSINKEGTDKELAEIERRKQAIRDEYAIKEEKLQQYRDLFSDVLTNIIDLSQQRYDRELLNLERERSAVESNTNLTEEERTASLNRIEARERELEIRRIKAERDQFQLKQALLLAEEILKTKSFVQEKIRINALTATEATAAASSVAIEGAKQTGKAAMSLGQFVANLGPLGVAVFAASIGGIIASIVAARKNARAQIDALGVPNVSGGGINPSAVPAAPTTVGNAEERAPQTFAATPMTRTYVLTGDVSSGMEAEAKLNTKRTIV